MRSTAYARLVLVSLAVTTAFACRAAPAVDQNTGDPNEPAMYRRIRDEGLLRSRVMEHAAALTDRIGARLTGSPNLDRAIGWATQALTSLGASNARAEVWGEFGLGWEQRHTWVRMTAPYPSAFVVTAAPWSPSTRKAVTADVVAVPGMADEAGFAPHRGKLRGKIVLLGRGGGPPVVLPIDKPLFERLDEAQLAQLVSEDDSASGPAERKLLEQAFAFAEFGERISRFFEQEGVVGVLVPSGNNPRGGASGGNIYGDWIYNLGAYAYQRPRAMRVPLVIVAVEEYLRMGRLLERGVPVRVEMNVDTQVTSDRVDGYNVLADIPGVDDRRRDEIVMVTAHLDSWAVGTGATDNAAGVAVVMEAARILTAVGARPARTIRVALWTGHEQGLLGSAAYVRRHVAEMGRASTEAQLRIPEAFRVREGAIERKPLYDRVSAVYNIDSGSGRIRALMASPNDALIPILDQWIAPLRDLGVTMVSRRPCGGDCRPFLDAGLPAMAFIQDPLDYETRTHHMSSDTYDHLIEEDLRQAAVVVATLLYQTATRNAMLPRVPVP